MTANLHYLVGYAKASMFIQKVAFESVPTNSVAPVQQQKTPAPVSRAAFAAGKAWSPSAKGYSNVTHNNAYNFNEADPNKRFHAISSNLTSSQYRKEDRKHREELEKAKQEARDSSWWLTKWWNGRSANKAQEEYDEFRRNAADEAAKKMVNDPGMDFLQLWQARHSNPGSVAPAISLTTGGNRDERTNMFRSVLSDVQDEFSARDDEARGFKVTPAWEA